MVVLFGLITLGGSLISWYSTLEFAEREFRQLLLRQFSIAAALSENGIALIGQMGLIWAHHSTLDEQLREAVEQNASGRYEKRLQILADEARADVAILVDRNGIILAHNMKPELIGRSLMSWSPVRKALLAGEPTTAILQDMGNLIIYSSSLMKGDHTEARDDNVLLGGLLFGYAANDELLQQLSADTYTGMTLVRRRAVMASTFNNQEQRLRTVPISYIGYKAMLDDPDNIQLMSMAGAVYFVRAKPLNLMEPSQEGSIMFSYSIDELDVIRNEIGQRFTLIFVLLFILLLLFSNWISRLVLGSMHDLLQRMELMLKKGAEAGDFMAVGGSDEIGVLADNFNQMLKIIQTKNQELHRQGMVLEARVDERTKVLTQLNAKLQQHAHQMSQAQQIASVGSWEYNPQQGSFDGSPETLKLLGLEDEFDGRFSTIVTRIHPDDRLHLVKSIQRSQVENRVTTLNLRLADSRSGEHILQIHSEASSNTDGVLGTLQDVTERKEAEALLVRQANFDTLTGIPNRNLFWDRMRQAISVCRREGHRMGVIFIDLDRFKEINDTLGHEMGDSLLKQVAVRLKHCLREADTVARYGGDEFVIILPLVDEMDNCASTAERIIEQISLPIELTEKDQGNVGASLGIAFFPDDAGDAETLVKCADEAMYKAKEGGRNSYCFYSAYVSESQFGGKENG